MSSFKIQLLKALTTTNSPPSSRKKQCWRLAGSFLIPTNNVDHGGAREGAVNFTGEKCLRMRPDVNHVVDFRQSLWLRGKIPAKCCQDERKNGSFFLSVVVLWFCCHCERSKIILVELFSDMCCLDDIASWNCQTNTLAGSISPRSVLRSLDARRSHAKEVGIFLCLV